MLYTEETPFYQLLATKYAAEREDEAIEILNEHPEIAQLEWPGPDSQGQPFVRGSTALHYAANDGKLRLIRRLIECGADVNASSACWFRSVLSWASNNARVETIRFLLSHGARPDSLSTRYMPLLGEVPIAENRLVPRTTTCGSGPNPCTTRPASRKWRVASPTGLSSASRHDGDAQPYSTGRSTG